MPADVTERAILDALHGIPQDRWGEVLHFLEVMMTPEPTVQTASDLAGSDLIGMWADRDDLGSTSEFAARLRMDNVESHER